MVFGIVMATTILVVLLLLAIISPGRKRKALQQKVSSQFGRADGDGRGLPVAESFWAAKPATVDETGLVDDLTWHDLAMDDIFARLNHCQSSFGDIRLYDALRRPGAGAAGLAEREALLRVLADDHDLLTRLAVNLAQLGRGNGYSLDLPLYHPQILRLDKRILLRLLALLPLLCLLLLPFSPLVGVVLCLLSLVANFCLCMFYKQKYSSGFYSVKYFAAAVKTATHMAKALAEVYPSLSNRLSGALKPFSVVKKSLAMLYVEDFFTEIVQFPNPLGFFLVPILSYGKVIDRLEALSQPLASLYDLLGEVDLACSLLSVREGLAVWCKPNFKDNGGLTFEGVYHPLVENPVPNDGQFQQGVLLTGSNASGKSTFIKAIAISCVSAQALGICFAHSFTLQRGGVATSMAIADDILAGDSYFIAEIKSMRRLLRMAEESSFSYFFIDEILRGTNTVERIAAASAVLLALSALPCLCFAATHDIELTTILQTHFANYHFGERIVGKDIIFDYKLTAGPATGRNAIALLGTFGFPPTTVAQANALAATFQQTGVWPSLADIPPVD